MSGLLTVFGSLGAGLCLFSAYSDLKDTLSLFKSVKKQCDNQRKWKKTKARVLSMSVGLEFEEYYKLLHEIGDREPTAVEADKLDALRLKGAENSALYENVNVMYEYEFEGEVFQNRNITVEPGFEKAYSILQKINASKTEVIAVRVNPDNPEEAVISIPSNSEIYRLKRRVLYTDKKMITYLVLGTILSLVTIVTI